MRNYCKIISSICVNFCVLQVVLQILKLKNVSASKAKPNSQTAPRLLKLSLTDGHTNCQAIEMRQIPALNLDNTVPGTKILIDGAQVLSGTILLDLKCCKILGGNVPALAERWELSKLMISHHRGIHFFFNYWFNTLTAELFFVILSLKPILFNILFQ